MLCMLVSVQAQDVKETTNCMSECYFQCMQVRVFTWNECKRECVNACGKPSYRAALLEDDGVQKNRRQEATEYGMSLSTLFR
ncbi:hypothetical protein RHGRI_025465 [Rhododendron griersonianum]|uniref:Uncharacterized protein n=1 Tax=Rhododendron griersonianum TaxID=479676 RepID=A0AAV6ITP6_9ERIC|nr:hypothetical protein RHGRI_025465 [Rhododendron griersonianum]